MVLLDSETARDDTAVLFVPEFDWHLQSSARQAAVRSVQGDSTRASGGDDAIVLHQVHIDVARGDARTISVAAEGVLDFRAPGVVTAEEAVQLHVVLLAVNDDAVRLVVAEH